MYFSKSLPPITVFRKSPISFTVVSPFYGLCEIFEKMTAIYGVLIFQKQPYMVLKQNWRNYSSFTKLSPSAELAKT
jgi:hypothetical protein